MGDGAARRRSPLAHRRPIEADGGALRLTEVPFLGKLILRAEQASAADRLRTATGLELPETLASAEAGAILALWLGPDEWMLLSPSDDASAVAAKASDAMAGLRHQLVDVGDYYTVIETSGAKAREALMKLTTLDLHQRAFPPGRVAGSVFGRANATLWLRSEAPDEARFWLLIRWSMADYLWRLLADAGREWGVPEQAAIRDERLTIS